MLVSLARHLSMRPITVGGMYTFACNHPEHGRNDNFPIVQDLDSENAGAERVYARGRTLFSLSSSADNGVLNQFLG